MSKMKVLVAKKTYFRSKTKNCCRASKLGFNTNLQRKGECGENDPQGFFFEYSF